MKYDEITTIMMGYDGSFLSPLVKGEGHMSYHVIEACFLMRRASWKPEDFDNLLRILHLNGWTPWTMHARSKAICTMQKDRQGMSRLSERKKERERYQETEKYNEAEGHRKVETRLVCFASGYDASELFAKASY